MGRLRRFVIAGLASVTALVTAVVLLSRGPFSGPRVDYSHVPSIAHMSTYQDPDLLARAFNLPVAARYRDGIEFQQNISMCGPTSVANILRSLGVPADQKSALSGTETTTVLGYLPAGLSLDRLARIAQHNLDRHADRIPASGVRRVTVLRDLDLAAFRAEIAHANDLGRRYILNFHRGPLFGRGGGHHSPIAGYLADRDLVLVLDVNVKFRPWLVPTDRLFSATDTVDFATQKKRGLIRIELD